MKKTISHETFGEIEYVERFWTGRKRLSINGVLLQKLSAKTFLSPNNTPIEVLGNYITGVKLKIGEEIIEISPKIKWYEVVLSLIPFLLIMVWGNVPALCAIVPVVGGLIGGFFSALFSVVNLLIIKGIRNIWLKILISIVTVAVTFVICFAVACAILSAINSLT